MHSRILALLLSSLLGVAGLSAMEIGGEGRSSSMYFPWAQTGALAGTSAWSPGSFTTWFYGGAGWLIIPMGEDFKFHLAYETDPVLRNVASGIFRFEKGVASVGVGPFMGFLNKDRRLYSLGLSTSILVQLPGIAFVSARSDGGLALGLVAGAASVPQTAAEIAAGFYTPNAVVSGSVSGKRFTMADSKGMLIEDALTRYALVVDIYKKNIPYQLKTTLGYEQRSKYFQASKLTDTLGSAIAGIKLTVTPFEGISFHGEFTNAIFTFGMDNLKGRSPSTRDVLFSASAGMTWNFEPEHLSWPAALKWPGAKK
jgi:hypothetical protein